MRIFKYLGILLAGMVLFAGCDKDEPTPPGPPELSKVKRTVLLYAVASNNLSYALDMDLKEVCSGASAVDLDNYRFLVYSVQADPKTGGSTVPKLRQLVKTSFGYDFKDIKQYEENPRSVDKERISQVIADVKEISPSDDYGIIFWSHSDAWRPASTWQPADGDSPMMHAFGQDFDGEKSHYCETEDLADAIPAGMFSYIWFDSCYMSNIESIYEFAGKADWFIGSATELNAYGMPYDITLPKLFGIGGGVAEAAEASVKYYNSMNSAITMCVVDMHRLDDVAAAARDCYSSFEPLPDDVLLQCYSRKLNPALYDFLQYSREVAAHTGTDVQPLADALDRFIVYAGQSARDFNGRPIEPDKYSGISAHSYRNKDSREEAKYRTLRWFRDVYPH